MWTVLETVLWVQGCLFSLFVDVQKFYNKTEVQK